MKTDPHKDNSNGEYEKNEEGNIIIIQSFLNQILLILAFIISILVGIWTTLNYPWSTELIELGSIGSTQLSFPLPLFAFPPLMFFILLMRAKCDKKLVLCPEYLIFVSGAFSWKEKTIRVEYQEIREIEIDHTIFQKIFNLGDLSILIISTQINSALTLPGVRNPTKLKNYLLNQKLLFSKNRPSS